MGETEDKTSAEKPAAKNKPDAPAAATEPAAEGAESKPAAAVDESKPAAPAEGAPAQQAPRGGAAGQSPRGPGGDRRPGRGRPGQRDGRPRPGGGGRRFFRRRKVDYYSVNKIDDINYKDVDTLRQFLGDRGKILPRRHTGLSAQHQRLVKRAIKRARNIALLPFAGDG